MKTIPSLIILSSIALLVGAGSFRRQADPKKGIEEELKKSVEANLKFSQNEDMDGVMETIHTKSLAYDTTEAQMEGLFEQYDLKYKLLSFQYIGKDKEYAVVRVKQETKKVKGPAFQDNVIDIMHIFRQEKEAWKIWQSAILEIEYID